MRWDSLFDDLAGQLDDELAVDDDAVRIEAERLRRGRLTLRERLIALCGDVGAPGPLVVELVDGTTWRLRVRSIGKDWMQADSGTTGGREVVVPLDSIAAVAMTQTQIDWSLDDVVVREPRLLDRLTVSFLLRDLCRRRAAVVVRTRTGSWTGTIDRVGRDHLDLAVHEPGSPRRSRGVEQIRVIVLSEVVVVERAV
ncbi:hypothetical protein SAMN06295974_3283 [Plantibacter flavus]|uniref:Uncharacterized protein n=1 Tax=Plantibacter flavus TaxID=150123 RepID=A0A3N2C4D2_9MICO|nr:hypothetical protein [Plantibacter flavus]ROR82388.1 hypothetical protein EDD42_2478 [Plantibacter flavus]SMG43702.1 hypothetical protein SAMN06295974_3283 [Plantibacter flavus]